MTRIRRPVDAIQPADDRRIETPPVVLPQGNHINAQPRDKSEPSRLDAGSNCRECGKWLPGERSLCGRCYARSA